MAVQSSCPDPEFWKGLLDGTLPPAEEKLLNVHLEVCARCQQVLQGLAAGSESWDGLPRYLAGEQPPEEPALRQIMAAMAGHRILAQT